MKGSFSSLKRRRGLTLVELLVVVVILVMLVAVTIPLMRSIRSGSELDAAVRKIESIISDARTRAIVTGRPAGITLIRDPLNNNVAFQVALAESPPPYAGDVIHARALVGEEVDHPDIPGVRIKRVEFDPTQVRRLRPTTSSSLDMGALADESAWFVRPGDTIRFNYRGATYTIRDVMDEYVLAVDPAVPLTNQFAYFQIQRAPRRSLTSPEELPQGAFVVLDSSGVAYKAQAVQLDPIKRLFSSGDVTIAFNAAGEVDRVYRGTPSPADLADLNALLTDLGVPVELARQRVIIRPLQPVRIDLASGSLLNPSNAMRMIVENGHTRPKSSRVD